MSENGLTALPIPVPPQFEEALGYEGDARWVGFYWEPAGDEAMYDDGQASGDTNWTGYLAYVDHPAVAPHLMRPCWQCRGRGTTNDLENEPCENCYGAGVLPLNLGSSDFEADCWLVVDRQERRAYVAPVGVAEAFLLGQWPELPQIDLTPGQWAEMIQRLQEELGRALTQGPILDDIEDMIRQQQEAVGKMTAWLDEWQIEHEEVLL